MADERRRSAGPLLQGISVAGWWLRRASVSLRTSTRRHGIDKAWHEDRHQPEDYHPHSNRLDTEVFRMAEAPQGTKKNDRLGKDVEVVQPEDAREIGPGVALSCRHLADSLYSPGQLLSRHSSR